MRPIFPVTVAILAAAHAAYGYQIERVPNQGPGTACAELFAHDGKLYFQANYATLGIELGEYDADANSGAGAGGMLADINTTTLHSSPKRFATYDGKLYFNADAGSSQPDLHVYDGVSVTRINQIRPGSGCNPDWLTVYDGKLYLAATDGYSLTTPPGVGDELWVWDGLTTTLVKDIREYSVAETPGQNESSFPSWMAAYQGDLYFKANKLDLPLPDLNAGTRMLRYDGATVSTLPAIDTAGPDDSDPWNMTVFDDKLFFIANDGQHGYEPWAYDGTNFQLVADINTTPQFTWTQSSAPTEDTVYRAVVYQGAVYFTAADGTHGLELWRYDGTTCEMVFDLEPTSDWSSNPYFLTVYRNQLWFSAWTHGEGRSLWVYDGQDVTMVADSAGDNPRFLTVYDANLYFVGEDTGLWRLVPEPASLALLGVGGLTLAGLRRRVRSATPPAG